MAYNPVNLGDVLQQVGAIKGQQQKQQMNALALTEAQKQQQDQSGIDTALTQNPNADLPTLIKAGGGMAGVSASQKLTEAHIADLTNHYRQTYLVASEAANSDNPAAVIQQKAPDFIQQYDQHHGPGAFAKLAQDPNALRQQAAQVAQQSMAGLVDPAKQFDAHQKMIEDHYKQEGPGGEQARAQAAIEARAQQEALNRGVTMRGQNITAANDLKPVVGPDGLPVYTPASQAAGKQAFNAATYFPGGMVGGAANGLTGQDFLSTLGPTQQAQVKALAEGRMAFPAGFALKSPYWQQMISAVSQYDPNFDAVNYNARAKTRNDFTSGKSAQNIKSLNTAIGHLGTLDSQIGGTASHALTPLNYLQNQAAQLTGSAGPTQFKQTASALASELTAVFRGQGGAEADVKRYLEELDPNASLEQKKAAVKNITELLASRTAAIGDQYNQGMGTTADPLTLLNSHAQQVLSTLRGSPPAQSAHPAAIQSLLEKYK
jgi:hypothetical protein